MSMKMAISFTNFGPYHLARLRALGQALARRGDTLVAYETAGTEQRYPWLVDADEEPFARITLFPDRTLESISGPACDRAMTEALARDRPDAVGIVGYSRPESMAALRWARSNQVPTVLMSESQEIDHPRTWWKEAIKRNRVRKFSAALVGGPRHRDYLITLGMPGGRIAFGYNAVDNERFAGLAEAAREASAGRVGLPRRPYFIAVNRFVPEKNLPRLVRAFARYRRSVPESTAWDLVLCGGGPGADSVEAAVLASGCTRSIHRPGFLQTGDLARWYAHASAFVHPSLQEPWGLVANEAAACRLPLLLSDRAGCAPTLVPEGLVSTGRRFDPLDENGLAGHLTWMAALNPEARAGLGRRAAEVVADWGPERFASGTLAALELASQAVARPVRAARESVR